jgi:hypothetical protein
LIESIFSSKKNVKKLLVSKLHMRFSSVTSKKKILKMDDKDKIKLTKSSSVVKPKIRVSKEIMNQLVKARLQEDLKKRNSIAQD